MKRPVIIIVIAVLIVGIIAYYVYWRKKQGQKTDDKGTNGGTTPNTTTTTTSSTAVKELQVALNHWLPATGFSLPSGKNKLVEDGIYGPDTKAATLWFGQKFLGYGSSATAPTTITASSSVLIAAKKGVDENWTLTT